MVLNVNEVDFFADSVWNKVQNEIEKSLLHPSFWFILSSH